MSNHQIADRFILQACKGAFAESLPHRATRRRFIQSVVELTDLRGQALRRWLRKSCALSGVYTR